VGHEGVEAGRLADRITRLAEVPLDLGPVIVIPEDGALLRTALASARAEATPRLTVRHVDGGVHHLATCSPARSAHVAALLAPTAAVVADGHHRAAAVAARGGGRGILLAWLVDPATLRIEAIHRRLPRLPHDWRGRLERVADLAPAPREVGAAAEAVRRIGTDVLALVTGQEAVLVRPRPALHALVPAGGSDRWRRLPAVLAAFALTAALGLDPADVVADLEDEGRIGPGAARVLLPPPAVEDVVALALAGEALPAKSTRFAPKPRTGLVLRQREGDEPEGP
jgi:hypothetical protein